LQKTEEGRKNKYNYSDPERVPLGFVPPIVPEMTDSSMVRLFEHLFQDHKPVAPILELNDVAITVHYPVSIQ
jgi:hypothetical protein